jgi:hypothetical protein
MQIVFLDCLCFVTLGKMSKMTGGISDSPPAPYPFPSTDPQSITYADCEAFFEAVTEGSREYLLMILNTHGPEVITELSKSYNKHGETPLLVSIKKGNVDMVKYLIGKLDVPIGQIGRFVWTGVEYVDVPALYVAIVSGEMDIAAYLLSKEVNSFQTAAIVESIMSSLNQRQEKINILELMGAFTLYFYETHPSPQNLIVYWREAMNLRNSTVDGEPTIPKTIVQSVFVGMNFGFTPECTTLEQLEQYTLFQLFTQAILVGQRVLNVVSPGPLHQFILISLCQCAAVNFYYREQRHYSIKILIFFLQQLQELHLQDCKTKKIIIWALYLIKEAISSSQAEDPSINNNAITSQEEFTYLMAAFDFSSNYMSVLQVNRHRNEKEEPNCLVNLAKYILDLILLLNKMRPKLNPEECQQLESSLSLFIRKDHRWGFTDRNLLHTICDFSDETQEMSQPWENWENLVRSYVMGYDEDDESSSDIRDHFSDEDYDPNFELIRNYDEVTENDEKEDNDLKLSVYKYLHVSTTQLILRLGADPNASDLHGCTPLHLLAKNRHNIAQSRLLIEYGAHIDRTDANNSTPLMLFQEWQRQLTYLGIPDLSIKSLLDYVLPPPQPLTCLASRVPNIYQLKFD